MKGRMCLAVVAVLFLLMPDFRIWAQESVVAKGEEELYGTWANENNRADVLHGQKVVVAADAMADIYCKVSDLAPAMEVSWDISSKWTDSEGNVWYKTLGTSTGGLYKGAKWQTLEKVSKSGSIWERAINLLERGRFHPAFYPGTIDPKGIYYRVLYRIEG